MECQDHGLKAIMEQIRELAQRLSATSGKNPVFFSLSVVSLYSLSQLPVNPAYLLQSDILVPAGVFFLSSLLFLITAIFVFFRPIEKIEYIIMLMWGICHNLPFVFIWRNSWQR
jgi:hypothetical protein